MKVSFFVTVQIVILFLSSCAKKAQPETTLNREGDSSINSNSGENGFNEGADDLAGLGDPLTRRF